MQDYPLLLSTLYERAVRIYPHREIVSATPDGSLHRTTYGQTDLRVRKLVTSLERLGIEAGEPVGTLAWNSHRHHEIYWATANSGRICHTVNARLFPEQIRYIIDHAGDRAVFVEESLVEMVEPLAAHLPKVTNWILLDGDPSSTTLPGAIGYEDLMPMHEPPGVIRSWPRRGAGITYPGHDLSPAALVGLIEGERVGRGPDRMARGPALPGGKPGPTSSIRSLLCGGSAVPRGLIDCFWPPY